MLACLLAGCSNSNPPNDASTDAPVDTGPKDAAPQDTGIVDTGPQPDVAVEPLLDPACAVPDAAPTNGSCVTIDDAGIECNPVTNAPCTATQACDFSTTGFHCYDPPPPNTAALCAACDVTDGTACTGTSTCVPVDGGSACARYCCDDTDCAPGHCDKTTFQSSPIGFCVN